MSTPTGNMDPNQSNAETRVVTVRLPVREIMRIPLEVVTGPTCTPQGGCPIRARVICICTTSGRRGTLCSCKYYCDPGKQGGWTGHWVKMVVHLTVHDKGDKSNRYRAHHRLRVYTEGLYTYTIKVIHIKLSAGYLSCDHSFPPLESKARTS